MKKVIQQAQRLRIYMGETDPFEKLLHIAKKEGLAGGTVYRGIMGYGPNKADIRTSQLLALSCDLPIVVEFVDTAENIARVYPLLEPFVQSGLTTLEKVEAVLYKKDA